MCRTSSFFFIKLICLYLFIRPVAFYFIFEQILKTLNRISLLMTLTPSQDVSVKCQRNCGNLHSLYNYCVWHISYLFIHSRRILETASVCKRVGSGFCFEWIVLTLNRSYLPTLHYCLWDTE